MFPFTPRALRASSEPPSSRTLAAYVWRMSGWSQFALALLAVTVASLAVVPIELQRGLVDDAIVPGDLNLLWYLAALYVLAVVANRIVKGALTVGQGWLAESAIRHTRSQIGHILYTHHAKRRDLPPGDTVSVLAHETIQLGGYVGEVPSRAIVNIATMVGTIGYMLWEDTKVAAVGLALLVPQLVLLPLMQRVINRLNAQHIRQQRALGNEVVECADEERRESRLDQLYRLKISIHLWKALMKGLLSLLGNLAPVGILIFGGLMVIEGTTTLGIVVAFVSGFQRIQDPVQDLFGLYRRTALAYVHHGLVRDWVEAEGQTTPSAWPRDPAQMAYAERA